MHFCRKKYFENLIIIVEIPKRNVYFVWFYALDTEGTGADR